MDEYSAWHALTGEHGPAPKEKEMEPAYPTCNKCSDRLCLYEVERGICQQCIDKKEARTAERRARFERAYMAVLPITTQFYLREQRFQAARMDAHRIALEIVRQWDAMMAELDGEEG